MIGFLFLIFYKAFNFFLKLLGRRLYNFYSSKFVALAILQLPYEFFKNSFMLSEMFLGLLFSCHSVVSSLFFGTIFPVLSVRHLFPEFSPQFRALSWKGALAGQFEVLKGFTVPAPIDLIRDPLLLTY